MSEKTYPSLAHTLFIQSAQAAKVERDQQYRSALEDAFNQRERRLAHVAAYVKQNILPNHSEGSYPHIYGTAILALANGEDDDY